MKIEGKDPFEVDGSVHFTPGEIDRIIKILEEAEIENNKTETNDL